MNITSVNSSATPVTTTTQAQDAAPAQASEQTNAESNEKSSSTRVTLSDLGQIFAAKRQAANQPVKNQDIDNSSLPDTIKDLLKRIRELQEQIREQQQKLNTIMANQRLSPEQKQQQMQQAQAMINALSGALNSAYGQLNKLTRDLELTKEQQMSVASLLATSA
jgi:predicted RNase H-like nuclease (RuvC/YqgF family)